MFKVSISLFVFLVSFLIPTAVLASTKITSLSVHRSATGVFIDLGFDRPVQAKALRPAFERDFAQIVFRGMKIDSARMVAVSGSEVQKVFAYPYNADTARLRIIFKREGSWGKGRISVWNNNPRSVRLFISERARKTAPLTAASAAAAVAAPSSRSPAPASAQGTVEEKAILNEVVANTRDIDINNPDSVKAALRATSESAGSGDSKSLSAIDKREEKGPIGISADPTKHFARMAIALFGVLALFIGGVFVVKKYAGQLKKLPFGKKERLIQVVATHYLGNKNSISLVKITGEYMVVGASNEGIALITKLGPELNVDKYIEDRFWSGTFEKHLNTFAKDTKAVKEIDLSTYDGARDLAREPVPVRVEQAAERIEDKVELSPIRASIKEKLTNLKPLA